MSVRVCPFGCVRSGVTVRLCNGRGGWSKETALFGCQCQNVYLALGGVLGVKKVGRALSRTEELFSGVENWISGFH